MSISIIIPVYKNKEQYLKFIKHNLPFFAGCEVIVVNDYPQESIKEDIKQFPQIKLIENKTNLGFGMTVNKGVQHATSKYIFLLNSDVKLTDNKFHKALEQFKYHPHLFAVSFAQKEKNNELVGKNIIYWEKGMFQHQKADTLTFGINGWAEGGSCIMDRGKFMELGGFDQLYTPFYWEDIDLSYRAWKKCYEILFDPSIVVEHHHESTIGKYFMPHHVRAIALRNQFTFIWKNISDANLLLQHIVLLPKLLLYYTVKGDTVFLKGFWQALLRLPSILATRKKLVAKQTDEKILKLFT